MCKFFKTFFTNLSRSLQLGYKVGKQVLLKLIHWRVSKLQPSDFQSDALANEPQGLTWGADSLVKFLSIPAGHAYVSTACQEKLCWISLHCNVFLSVCFKLCDAILCCIVFKVFYCIALHCIVLCLLYCFILYALYCIVLYILHCIVFKANLPSSGARV